MKNRIYRRSEIPALLIWVCCNQLHCAAALLVVLRPTTSGIKYAILPELIENVSGIIPGNIGFNIALILSQLL